MKTAHVRSALAGVLLVCVPLSARADQRHYVWTYQYLTMPKGEVEMENYITFSTPDIGGFEGQTSFEYLLEFEIGMTDRFDFAVYQIFEQQPESSLVYKGYRLRARYRIGERGVYPMDPLVYLEYKGKTDFSEHGLEFKLILAKDIGDLNVALNPILELEVDGDEWELEPEYTAGASYAVFGDLFRTGIELEGSGYGHYVGPVIAHGGEKAWASLGSAIKISDIDRGKPEVRIRLIMGFNL